MSAVQQHCMQICGSIHVWIIIQLIPSDYKMCHLDEIPVQLIFTKTRWRLSFTTVDTNIAICHFKFHASLQVNKCAAQLQLYEITIAYLTVKLFESTDNHTITAFIKGTHFYHQL